MCDKSLLVSSPKKMIFCECESQDEEFLDSLDLPDFLFKISLIHENSLSASYSYTEILSCSGSPNWVRVNPVKVDAPQLVIPLSVLKTFSKLKELYLICSTDGVNEVILFPFVNKVRPRVT